MKTNFTAELKPATEKDLYDISLRSSHTKDKRVYIYELRDLTKLLGEKRSQELRQNFLKNKIKIQQITNNPTLPKFSRNDKFINSCMKFRYVPKDVFTIKNETLIFDETVAIYTYRPKIKLLVVNDKGYSENQKQLFKNLWGLGLQPKLGFRYVPNHSFYKSIDLFAGKKQLIVYPDKDAIISYSGLNRKNLQEYLSDIVKNDSEYFRDADFIISFIWNFKKKRMVDMWKFNSNYVDDRSGPLGEVRVYQDGKRCNSLGMASGNTLLVLGFEEKLRRQTGSLRSYLKGHPPVLPLEILNNRNFFKDNGSAE